MLVKSYKLCLSRRYWGQYNRRWEIGNQVLSG